MQGLCQVDGSGSCKVACWNQAEELQVVGYTVVWQLLEGGW